MIIVVFTGFTIIVYTQKNIPSIVFLILRLLFFCILTYFVYTKAHWMFILLVSLIYTVITVNPSNIDNDYYVWIASESRNQKKEDFSNPEFFQLNENNFGKVKVNKFPNDSDINFKIQKEIDTKRMNYQCL